MTKEDRYTDPERSGMRSGKGTSLLGSIILGIEDKEFEDNGEGEEHGNYSNPEETGLRSGTGKGIISKIISKIS